MALYLPAETLIYDEIIHNPVSINFPTRARIACAGNAERSTCRGEREMSQRLSIRGERIENLFQRHSASRSIAFSHSYESTYDRRIPPRRLATICNS